MDTPDPTIDTSSDAEPTVITPAGGPIPVTPPKPGWQTTEFWTALAPLAVFVIALFTHRQVDQGTAGALLAGVGTVAAGGYAVYRQVLKVTHVKAAQQAHADALAAMPATLTIEPADVHRIVGGVAEHISDMVRTGAIKAPPTTRSTRPASKRPASKRPAAKAAAKRKATRSR